MVKISVGPTPAKNPDRPGVGTRPPFLTRRPARAARSGGGSRTGDLAPESETTRSSPTRDDQARSPAARRADHSRDLTSPWRRRRTGAPGGVTAPSVSAVGVATDAFVGPDSTGRRDAWASSSAATHRGSRPVCRTARASPTCDTRDVPDRRGAGFVQPRPGGLGRLDVPVARGAQYRAAQAPSKIRQVIQYLSER